MKVAITTLGCKTNQFESAAMSEKLGKEGFEVVPFEGRADIYVINTCTVTARTDAESRRLIRRAMRQNPASKIVVTGCYAQVAPAELEKMAGINLIIGNTEKKEIARLLRELGDEQKILVSDISREEKAEALPLESFADHTRAFLQVQNGCDAFCSYCIVPYARGRSRSVLPEAVLAGCSTFADRGFQEVVLTGIHLSGYGRDLVPPLSLLQLLSMIEERQLSPRLRLGSLEPMEIADELIAFIAASAYICPHLHIPLQSGDDDVLRRMNRNYSTQFFHDLLHRITEQIPDICIGIDIIAGFPGETEREFSNSHAFVESLPVAYMHVFPFSPRPGTPAAIMQDRLAPSLISERARLLRLVSEQKKAEYARRFLGKEVRVLVQSRNGDGMLSGLSRHYLPVSFAGPESLHNREVPVTIYSSTGRALLGKHV